MEAAEKQHKTRSKHEEKVRTNEIDDVGDEISDVKAEEKAHKKAPTPSGAPSAAACDSSANEERERRGHSSL